MPALYSPFPDCGGGLDSWQGVTWDMPASENIVWAEVAEPF